MSNAGVGETIERVGRYLEDARGSISEVFRSPSDLSRWGGRYANLMLGFLVLALGMELTVEGRVGVSPWSTLHLGISARTGLTFGQVIQGLGLVLIICCSLAGIRPKIGTWLNMIFLGLFVDIIAGWKIVGAHPGFLAGSLVTALGHVLTGVGTAMYITADLGAGPRDTLMVVLTQKSGWSVGLIRSLIEAVVLVTGYLLGGPVGIGTVMAVLIVGPSVQWSLKGLAHISRSGVFRGVIKVPAALRKSV